jgi:hypothetical protein
MVTIEATEDIGITALATVATATIGTRSQRSERAL